MRRFFNLYPHCGYLNTMFTVCNISDNDISIIDHSRGRESVIGHIMPGAKHTFKLEEGSHTLYVDGYFDGQKELAVVEDAIKLGGGRETAAYVSDKSVWGLLKMTDRLYFFNRKTGEEYVEMNLVPEQVDFLSDKTLLFYGQDKFCSVYSFDSRSMIFESEKPPIFKSERTLLFIKEEEDKGGALNLIVVSAEGQLYELTTKEYSLNDDRHELYLFDNNVIKTYSLDSTSFVYSAIPLDTYITLISCGFYVTRNSRGEYSIIDIRDGKNKYYGRLDDSLHIISIQNVGFLDEETLKTLEQEVKRIYEEIPNNKQSLLSVTFKYLEIRDFFLFNNSLYYRYNETTGSCNSNTKTYLCQLGGNSKIQIARNADVFVKNGFIVVATMNKVITVSENQDVKEYKARFINCKDGSLIEERLDNNGRRLLSLSGDILYDKEYSPVITRWSDRRKDICILNERGIVCSEDSEHNQELISAFNPGITLVKAGVNEIISNHLVIKDDDIINLVLKDKIRDISSFVSIRDILAISESGRFVLRCSRNNHHEIVAFYLHEWDEFSSCYSKSRVLESLFDYSVYRNVLFAGSGDYIVYSDSNGLYYTKNLVSGQVTEYDSTKFVEQINGYRSIIRFVGNGVADPRVTDPVTGQFLDAFDFADYHFISPDKNLVVEKPSLQECADDGAGFIEHINRVTMQQVDIVQFNQIKEEYNSSSFNTPDTEIINKRIALMKKYPELFVEPINRRMNRFLNNQTMDINTNDIQSYRDSSSYSMNTKEKGIHDFVHYTHDFVRYYIKTNEFITVTDRANGQTIKLNLGIPLWFLNYISFSYDSRYIAIAGRYPDDTIDDDWHNVSGLFYLYDLDQMSIAEKSTSSYAVWVVSFTKAGKIAYYDSHPITFFKIAPDADPIKIGSRSFLTFSPSGKLFALSEQGYVRKDHHGSRKWGHQPSTNVYLRLSDAPTNEIAHFNDHGAPISNTNSKTVCMVAFTNDDKRMLSVSDDGVVVIRNLNLKECLSSNLHKTANSDNRITNMPLDFHEDVSDLDEYVSKIGRPTDYPDDLPF